MEDFRFRLNKQGIKLTEMAVGFMNDIELIFQFLGEQLTDNELKNAKVSYLATLSNVLLKQHPREDEKRI